MIEPLLFFALAIATAAVSLGIGLAVGCKISRSDSVKAKTVMEAADAHIVLCRNALNEVKEEQGNILSHLMRIEADEQKRHMADMSQMSQMLGSFAGGAAQPTQHPIIGSPMARHVSQHSKEPVP